MGHPAAAGALKRVVVASARLLCGAVAAGAALCLAAWLLYLGTLKYREDAPWRVFPPDYGCNRHQLVDKCTAQDAAYMWLAPMLLALASLALLWLRAHLTAAGGGGGAAAEGGGGSERSGAAARLAGRLLPPRRFWLWWCGGLSVADGLAIAFWAAFNASWAVAVLSRFFSLIPFFSKGSHNVGQLELQLVAVACGVFLLPNFVLLFYPVTRGSVVLAATGISYPDAIRYHRWLGHAVMVLATSHSLGFWGIWLAQGKWLTEALDRGAVFNNLAGGVSFLGGLALWLSSLEAARRASYEAFYKLHHIGFWVFMFAGCCHYWEMVWFFLPGLVLYGVDGVYRIAQGLGRAGASSSSTASGGVRVEAAQASPGGTTCSLLLVAPRLGVAPSGFVWLNVPALSWHSWHPFEYFAVPAAGGATGMLLHIKAYDRWTRRLLQLVAAKGAGFTVKIEGPYAELPGAVLGHPELLPAHDNASAGGGGGAKAPAGHSNHGVDGLVIAAGGVGATAAMSVFQELGTSGEAVAGLPTLLVWCCRKADEFEFLAPRLLAMARALRLDLTVRLFCTGDPATTSGAALSAGKPAASPAVPVSRNGGSSRMSAPGAARARSSTGLTTTSMCPVVGLSNFNCQAGHKLLLHVLAFAGTICAILAVRYLSEVRPAAAGLEPWTTGQRGASLVVGISAAILLPGSLALWAALAAQAWQARRAAGAAGAAGGSSGKRASPPKKRAQAPELRSYLLSDAESSPDVTPTAARAAAANPLAAPTRVPPPPPPPAGCASDTGLLSSVAAAAIAAQGCATVRPAPAGGWELVLPPAGAATDVSNDLLHAHQSDTGAGAAATTVALEAGRPPLAALLGAWLAGLKQLPSSEEAAPLAASNGGARSQLLQVAVYGMGPTPLVQDAKLLCDTINSSQQAAGGGSTAWLRFVQKTHEL